MVTGHSCILDTDGDWMICVVDVFNRAVKACTGQSLDKALVNVVFQLFDNDGDGHLSHGEFISVMKNRLHRGFRVSLSGVISEHCSLTSDIPSPHMSA